MARKNVKVVIPTNADELIELGEGIIAKHTADGAGSPLSGLDMTAFTTRVTDAETQNSLQKQLRRDAELATESRDGLLGRHKDQNVNSDGTVLNMVSRVRDMLLGLYKGNEQQLGLWGFDVNQSTTGGSTGGSSGGGGTPLPATGSISGTVSNSVTLTGISGALVEVVGTGIGTTSDGTGAFSLSGIPTGSQTIRISAAGYDTVEGATILVEGVNPPQNVLLNPSV